MKKALYLGASMLAVAAAAIVPASAADIYRGEAGGFKDAYAATWTGFYLGVNGGYGSSAGKGTATANAFDDDSRTTPPGFVFSNPAPVSFDRSGGFAGGQIGYNWQQDDHLVFGIEADLQRAGISGSAKTRSVADINLNGQPDVITNVTANSSLDWFGTVRGRVGYTFDRALIYATGGLAFGGAWRLDGSVNDSVTNSTNFRGFQTTASAKSDDTHVGFALGGGLEYALTSAWSLKAEYQYIDLGSSNLGTQVANPSPNDGGSETGFGSLKVDHTYHTARVGLNYHVGHGYEPLK